MSILHKTILQGKYLPLYESNGQFHLQVDGIVSILPTLVDLLATAAYEDNQRQAQMVKYMETRPGPPMVIPDLLMF